MKEKHKKYCLVFDTDSCTDGAEFDDFEAAKATMIDIYISWATDESADWKTKEENNRWILNPTEEQIEEWDYMIESCTCWIAEWNEEEKTYYDDDMNYYFLSNEECEEINWQYWDEIVKKYN